MAHVVTYWAVYDPNWGEPVPMLTTIAETEKEAIEKATKTDERGANLYSQANLRNSSVEESWKNLTSQGYFAKEILVTSAPVQKPHGLDDGFWRDIEAMIDRNEHGEALVLIAERYAKDTPLPYEFGKLEDTRTHLGYVPNPLIALRNSLRRRLRNVIVRDNHRVFEKWKHLI